jgi:RimJ/RimL family protein N-acetyltransferase
MNEASRSAIESGPHAFPIGPGSTMTVFRNGAELRVVSNGETQMLLRLDEDQKLVKLLDVPGDPRLALRAMSAAAEALFGWHVELDRLDLDLGGQGQLKAELLKHGLAVMTGTRLALLPDVAMQRRDNWLVDAGLPPLPKHYVMTDGKRHPQRAPKPEGLVYARYIPWLAEVISFRVANLEDDLRPFHRWMNDPRVAAFWDEAGDLEKHRTYLAKIRADPHMLPLIGCFGGAPFGYFEVYWAKENRIAPFYDAEDYDRGWHVVVGEDAYRGRRFISAWLPSLMHYIFLDDCRTQRIVGEPAAAHRQQLRNLEISGFAKIKNFDFPHKRATLVMLLRERFFGDRLWLPAQTAPATQA